MRPLLVNLLRWLAEALVRLYYPRRTMAGTEHLPIAGPTLYVANHPNGLLDPLVLRVAVGRPVRFLAKNTLWGNPFGRLAMDAFACLPVFRQQDMTVDQRGTSVARNEETFARCRAELAGGGEIALYPEGTSHSDPQLKPLKSGAARIALSAAAESLAANRPPPRLAPVGSHYEAKSIFRSGVHLVVGPPIDLAPLARRFAGDAPGAIEALTGEIRGRLDQLVLQAETRELLAGIARVASWTASDPGDDAPDRRFARAQELVAAYGKMRVSDPARLEAVARAARQYARILDRFGVRDPWQLEVPRLRAREVLGACVRAVAMTPAALWGLVTSWVPYRLSGVVARRMTDDEDTLSTFKMITGFTFLILAWIGEAFAIGWRFGVLAALASVVVAPFAGYAALRFGENLRELAEAIRHIGWRAEGTTLARLEERRRRLATDVAQALRQVQS